MFLKLNSLNYGFIFLTVVALLGPRSPPKLSILGTEVFLDNIPPPSGFERILNQLAIVCVRNNDIILNLVFIALENTVGQIDGKPKVNVAVQLDVKNHLSVKFLVF